MSTDMKLFYVGDRFYHESGTMMSSIYRESGERSDWGFVQCHLRDGGTVSIRQATAREMTTAYAKLAELKERREQATAGRCATGHDWIRRGEGSCGDRYTCLRCGERKP